MNWSTIVLEIVNFLVLVWLLKHFLYQPVRHVIETRQAAIEKTLSEAREREQAAGKLREEYENRLADWQQEKQAAKAALAQEMQRRREQELASLQAALAAERERAEVVAGREAQEQAVQRDREALALAGRFAARLLERVSGPEVEARLVALFCDQLGGVADAQRAALRRGAPGEGGSVAVVTAYPLADELRARLADATREVVGHAVDLACSEQPELVAGIRMTVGDWTLGANLSDELDFFAEHAHGAA